MNLIARRCALKAAVVLAFYLPTALASENSTPAPGVWSFRNGFTGHFPNSSPPISWSETENVLWRVPLSRRVNASPVIVGNYVFTLDEPHTLICINKADGRELWRRTHELADLLGPSAKDRPPLPRTDWLSTYGYTTPTPVSDGKRIWCVFGHGIVVCYDLSGTRQWFAEFDVADKISGVAVSPCLVDGVLIVGGKGDDRLCGFDAQTGVKLWHTDEGTQEGSCVPIVLNGKRYVVASAGLLIDPQTGKILQRGLLGAGFQGDSTKLPVNWGPTVVVDQNVAYFHAHFQPDQYNTALRAVKLDPASPPEQLWEFYPNTNGDIRGRMGNSPLLDHGLLYTVKDGGVLQVFAAANGSLVYEHHLPRHSYASLALAGPFIYAFGGSTVTIFKPGRAFEQVAQFKHGFHDFIASPVFEDRRMYFRDSSGLWCIEAPLPANSSAELVASAPPLATRNAAHIPDDGPDLADTAKTAPLLSYSEWLLEYDQTRLPLRRFSLIFEWLCAVLAIGIAAALLRRDYSRPRGALLAFLALALAAMFPALMYVDRLGNAFYPVGVWCLAGGLFAWRLATRPPRRTRSARMLPQTKTVTRWSEVGALLWGWLLGGAAGLALHHIPLQLAIIWYVLTGWQK